MSSKGRSKSKEIPVDKVILGMDPGTTLMGYGLVQVNGSKLHMLNMGVIHLSKLEDHSDKLKRIFERTLGLIDEYNPDEFAVEAPFYGKNVQSMLKLGRAQGVSMAAALYRNIPITEYSPRKIKQSITGSGNASKEQVAAMLKNAPQPDLARRFMDFILTPDFQSVIPTTNWMYPAGKADLPDAFAGLIQPGESRLYSPQEVAQNLFDMSDSRTQLPIRSKHYTFRLDTFCNRPSCRDFLAFQNGRHYIFPLDNLYTWCTPLDLQGTSQLDKTGTRRYFLCSRLKCSGHFGTLCNLQH